MLMTGLSASGIYRPDESRSFPQVDQSYLAASLSRGCFPTLRMATPVIATANSANDA